MGIATLGKSLLSSAKKKAKKGQQLGMFAGAAIGVAGIANSVIRRKAMDRANAFEKSLTPVKKALDKDFLQLGDIEAEYNTRSKLPGGELQSFIDEEFKLLKAQTGTVATGEAKPSDQMYLDLAKKQALSKYEIYKQRVDAYKPMFGVKTEEYYKQYNNLKTLTGVELKNDNLMELLGNKTGWGKDTAQVATEIMLANGKSATLNIPANILEKFDIEYFNKIEERARRATTIEEIRNKQLITLDEKAKTTNAKALLLSVTPKPSSAVKIDSEVDKAWLKISKPRTGTGTVKPINPDYIGDQFIFIDKKDKFKTEFELEELLEKLDEINHETGEPFKDTEIGGISNRDVLVNKAKEYAQLMKEQFMINGSGVVDNIMYEGWVKKGLEKALQGVTIVTDPGFFYGLGPNSTEISLSYAPVDDTPTEVPEPILMLRNRIAEYQDNPMGLPSGVLKDIQRMVEEFPDYKDEFSVYLEDMTRVDGTEKSDEEKTDDDIQLGVRNNNPLNVRDSDANEWLGQVGAYEGYATYENDLYGLRAADIVLAKYKTKHNINTIEGTISRWAPTSENPTASYIKAVSKRLGMEPNQEIDLGNPEFREQLILAMQKTETPDAKITVDMIRESRTLQAPVAPKSLLGMNETEVMNSAAADKARGEAAAIPGQVVKGVSNFVDAKILENLEEIVVKMKDGKPAIGTSTARVATWLKNTKDISYYKLSKEERIEAIEEYIETLKS